MAEENKAGAPAGAERTPTGVPGLDDMIEGGFKKCNTILVSGGCGSGKTTLAMQYVYEGAKNGEPGVYITFEEYPESIKSNFKRYGWDIGAMEENGKIRMLRIDPEDILHVVEESYGTIVDGIKDIKAERIVVDSISSLEAMLENDYESRRAVIKLLGWLRENKCTSILIGEAEQDPNEYLRHGTLEFSVDGVIVMYNIRRENARHRAMEILKMRGTKHVTKIVPFMIKNGITVLPKQKLFGVV